MYNTHFRKKKHTTEKHLSYLSTLSMSSIIHYLQFFLLGSTVLLFQTHNCYPSTTMLVYNRGSAPPHFEDSTLLRRISTRRARRGLTSLSGHRWRLNLSTIRHSSSSASSISRFSTALHPELRSRRL